MWRSDTRIRGSLVVLKVVYSNSNFFNPQRIHVDGDDPLSSGLFSPDSHTVTRNFAMDSDAKFNDDSAMNLIEQSGGAV